MFYKSVKLDLDRQKISADPANKLCFGMMVRGWGSLPEEELGECGVELELVRVEELEPLIRRHQPVLHSIVTEL